MLQLCILSATYLLFIESKLRKVKAKAELNSLYGRVALANEKAKTLSSNYLRVVGQRDEAL